MKKIIIFLTALINFFYSYSQIEPVTGIPYLDNGRFDNIFRKYYKDTIPPTYFVVTFDPSLSALTLAGEIYAAYKQIRIFQKEIPIYFIYQNWGVVTNKPGFVDKYFKEIFRIDTKDDKNVFIIESDLLYDSLNINRAMSKWFYVYHNRLIGANAVKLHFLSDDNYNFPRDVITLGKPKKIKIVEDSLYLSVYRDILRSYVPGKLLYVTDMNNTIHILNTNTGKFEKSFDKNTFDPIDYYCKKISESDKNCDIARKNNFKDATNRDHSYLTIPFFNGGYIYTTTVLEIVVPWEDGLYKDYKYYKYTNEFGKKVKYKEDFTGDNFLTLLKLDTTLNLIDAYKINTLSWPTKLRAPRDPGYWSGLDRGYYVKDSIFIVENNPDGEDLAYHKLPQRLKYKFSVFSLEKKNSYNFDKFLPIYYDNHRFSCIINSPKLF